MKTKKEVIAERPEYTKLINAVISKVGIDAVPDVNNSFCGIAAGFNGFIYYSDNHSFALRHRTLITKLLEETADSLGEDVVGMVGHFGVFRDSPMDADDRKDLYKYLGGGKPEQGTITNVMAWFAAESICSWFEE